MPSVFGDHMVLQQDARLPVWGWADPGEKVKIKLGARELETAAGADGAWKVEFPPQLRPDGDAPQVLTVTGKNELTFQDVLIGDVWVASGQSNMAFGIARDYQGAKAIAEAVNPKIRLFYVDEATAMSPLRGDALKGRWVVCTPGSLRTTGLALGFSAVAYYFGSEIARATGRPVGLIGSYWGGTPVQAWTSISGLEKEPRLAGYVATHRKLAANFESASASYAKQKSDFDAANKDWFTRIGKDYYRETAEWTAAAARATAAGRPVPPKPKLKEAKPLPPEAPDGGQKGPGTLFNAMIAPLIPYAIKGVIWYQGEGNTGRTDAPLYGIAFARLITDWREKWGQGDFPFLFVQLANISAPARSPSETTGCVLVREGQLKALSLPATGMAVAVDIGNPYDIHPADKRDVGLRLALAGRHVAYGEDVVFSGPLYSRMAIEGKSIRLTFANTGTGMMMGVPPWTPSGTVPAAPRELTGFAIAGADRKWFWAQASIDGDSIVVSSNKVEAPVAVRYGWASCPPCNLYNREGLPASPFRTDDWEDTPPSRSRAGDEEAP